MLLFSLVRVVILFFCHEEGQTSPPCTSEHLFTMFRSCYRLGPLTTACTLFTHKFIEVRVRFVKSYQKPCHWLNKKLANRHVSSTMEKQIKAHLFQQKTHKHCCSFHSLSGYDFPQQLWSCKISLWKSCIPSLDGLMNVLPEQTAATQTPGTTFEMSPQHNQATITTHTKRSLIKVGGKKKVSSVFFYLVFSKIFCLLKMILGFFYNIVSQALTANLYQTYQ